MSIEAFQPFQPIDDRRTNPYERRGLVHVPGIMDGEPAVAPDKIAPGIPNLEIDRQGTIPKARNDGIGALTIQVALESNFTNGNIAVAQEAAQAITEVSRSFIDAVAQHPINEPAPHERRTQVVSRPVEGVDGQSSWTPGQCYSYSSQDPFQQTNPELVDAVNTLIDTTMVQIEALRYTQDPELTYLTANRSKGGKKQTLPTKIIASMDSGIGDWVVHLPDAERLRPVAKPWSDEGTIVVDDAGQIVEIPQTKALQALVGAGADGRAVREREAWERNTMAELLDTECLDNNELVITSLGTGTGEPAMDTAIDVMNAAYGDSYKIVMNGFDVNPRSLAVAQHIANNKQLDGQLTFNARMANLLSKEGIQEAVSGTSAHVYEAIGFAEYVPSDGAPTEIERAQRYFMQRAGCLSAQEFYGAIYENMPEGSVLLTGNMRDDSPQASFIVDGLGWKGIIQRSTKDYLRIMQEAGIPGEAVKLYMPDTDNSAAVYNLVAITKL